MTRTQNAISRRSLLKAGLFLAGDLALPVRALAATETMRADVRLGMLIRVRALHESGLLQRAIRACHAAHNVPDLPAPGPGEPDRRLDWIRAEPFARAFPDQDPRFLPDPLQTAVFPTLCNHCGNPPCVRVCPTGASFQERDGRVDLDPHRCIGCRYCLVACPYGARNFNFCDPRPFVADPVSSYPTRARGVVEKCTFCPERLARNLAPWCVEAAQGAIIFGNLHDPESAIRRHLTRYPALQRKAALGTGPAVYYAVS
ncbi:MAG: 4Fe-4S dicluster domain-containing protein [Deltaproteobacteria bacterium]|jgi:molybdopterin-containing oxidoreductase family iron-sulfur binding subunit|nr:4Fe-4S dicluster domain-containing protein [Deltaproteobacteria bacterium]